MAAIKTGNQLTNPYGWQTFTFENTADPGGNGGGPGAVLRRAMSLFGSTALAYLGAEYGQTGIAETRSPEIALPAIVGGKPRAIPVQQVAPPTSGG